MSDSAYTMLMYDVISYARGHECEGCPLKNSGVIKYGSCAFRLSIFYKNDRNIEKTNKEIMSNFKKGWE